MLSRDIRAFQRHPCFPETSVLSRDIRAFQFELYKTLSTTHCELNNLPIITLLHAKLLRSMLYKQK